MIDFKKACEAFSNYLKDYDLNDGMIDLKIRHTYGVVELSEYIAKDLKLSDEDILLAKLIGLLHDIARFEQAKEYGDYRDYVTLDHADLGVKILFEDGLIRNFVNDNKYDSIIMKAIKNHNKLCIDETDMNDRELLHAKIIRDADKTDNFRVKTIESFEDIFNSSQDKLDNSTITDKIYNDFMDGKIIVSNERITDMDFWISYIAYIFDYNFVSGLKYIKEHDYINKILDRVDYKVEDTKIKMDNIRKFALEYVDNRIKEGK